MNIYQNLNISFSDLTRIVLEAWIMKNCWIMKNLKIRET